jgi:hypothetical protein
MARVSKKAGEAVYIHELAGILASRRTHLDGVGAKQRCVVREEKRRRRTEHPGGTITRANRVIYLRRMLEELAWTQQLPALTHLLGRDDVPRKEHYGPVELDRGIGIRYIIRSSCRQPSATKPSACRKRPAGVRWR